MCTNTNITFTIFILFSKEYILLTKLMENYRHLINKESIKLNFNTIFTILFPQLSNKFFVNQDIYTNFIIYFFLCLKHNSLIFETSLNNKTNNLNVKQKF